MIFKKLSSLLIAVACCAQAWAAPTGHVEGKIIDQRTKQALEFVAVGIRPQDSNTLIKGTITNAEGDFVIEGIPEGKYVLTASFLGYKELSREFSIGKAGADVDLHALPLEQDSQQLEEIQVTGQKSQMRFDLDKKVFNVDQNIASTGGSASDVLSNIPSVEVDHEGQVSLRGSTGVTVWINGKASGLSSDNRGDILQQLPAESIERIEVITNPSAKYSSEGTAGIINIVLKRDRRAGYYGGIQAGANTHGGYNLSGNINYSSGPLEAYANVGYRKNIFKNGNTTVRNYLTADTVASSLSQTSESEMNGGMVHLRAGATWHATEKDHISIGGMGMWGNHDRDGGIDYVSTGQSAYTRQRLQIESGDMRMMNIEVGYKHDFSEESNIDFTLSHNQWKPGRDAIYDDATLYADGTQQTQYQMQSSRTRNKSWEAQLDYVNKWGNNSFEAGYKGNFRRNENPVETYDGSTADDAAFNANLYNRFQYDQDIHAIYATYGGKWGNLSGQAGLRGEYTDRRTTSTAWDEAANAETDGDTFTDEYFELFPTLFLSYNMEAAGEVQINYTRRISRPWGGQLNSFRNITDATNISFGNPELTPEFSNAYELNYIKMWEMHTLSFSGYYRTTDDVIQRISYRTADNVMYSTHENVSKSQSAGIELVAKNKLFERLDLTSTVNLYYYKLDGFSFMPDGAVAAVVGEEESDFSWNARVIANVALPASFTLQLTGSYNARQVIAQGYRRASYSLDAGLRKSFLNNKLGISINARDLLDSRKWETVTSGAGFNQESSNWWGGRFAGLTVTYSFGNMRADDRQRQQQQGDAGGGAESFGGGMEGAF